MSKNFYFGYCETLRKYFVSRLLFVSATSPIALYTYNYVFIYVFIMLLSCRSSQRLASTEYFCFQPVSQSASQSDSQSVSQPDSQSVSQSARQTDSQSVSQTVSQSASQ